MASPSMPHHVRHHHHHHNPDHLITIKISYQGTSRKCKLPLGDMAPGVLEDKLRNFLDVPSSQDLLFERFSDSAGSYIALSHVNPSVWKQLNRAARAKYKLKIRVSDCFDPSREEEEEEADEPVREEPVPALPVREEKTRIDSPAPALFDATQEHDKAPNAMTNKHPESTAPLRPENPPAPIQAFTVCCNHCDSSIPDVHYHCTICDDGDFDLCPSCVANGVRCTMDHMLIHRVTRDGAFVYRTGDPIYPSMCPPAAQKEKVVEPEAPRVAQSPSGIRTCNCCVRDFLESNFVHCVVCEDYDVCHDCFLRDAHGHHPNHEFISAVPMADIDEHLAAKMAPGRNVAHRAICDGCDRFIAGVRHKCLDCPDWDYCADCVVNASYTHEGHRFAPLYETLPEVHTSDVRSVHFGICCDGPHCNPTTSRAQEYITGIRYKCAVCHDTDFCAVCEASPINKHNRTHPLIKFKTAVRRVSVTTHGEDECGDRMQLMGDRQPRPSPMVSESCRMSMKNVQTVVDVVPTLAKVEEPKEEEEEVKEVEVKEEPKEEPREEPREIEEEVKEAPKKVEVEPEAPKEPQPMASFVSDVIADGTEFAPNAIFVQTWVLSNTGDAPWPAGCSVKFVGGDYMGHVDSNRPAGIPELVSASESTACLSPLEPGRSFPFTVYLRSPPSDGKFTSYWRLSTKDGHKFGDRLWCDIKVLPAAAKPQAMVFPTLETESPASGSLVLSSPASAAAAPADTDADDFEECDDLDEWDASDEGFDTDEEYDILDASEEPVQVKQ